mmetsp:Transcript_55635/g.92533  ORF Transcript_55635/g.92533 Transcript_55635/m.92533 type:complete len:255 (-) Transcript_55635:259-1023(-)
MYNIMQDSFLFTAAMMFTNRSFCAFLFIILLRQPKFRLFLHNIRQYRSTEKHHIFTSWWIFNLELEFRQPTAITFGDMLHPQLLHILLQTRGQASKHGGTATQHHMLEKLGAQINVRFLDRIEQQLVQALAFHASLVGIKQDFRRFKAFASHFNNATIGQLEWLHQRRGFQRQSTLDCQVIADIAQLFLDLSRSIKIRRSIQGIAPQLQQVDEVLRDMTPGHIQAFNEVREAVAFIDGDHVTDAIATVQHDASQ